MDKEKMENIICYETKPVFVGQELKGYFIDTENFKKILRALEVIEN